MEIGENMEPEPLYSSAELDKEEGKGIEALIAASTEPIPDPAEWIDEELQRSVLITTIDAFINWGRKWSIHPLASGLACCTWEMFSSHFPRYDMARLGMEAMRATPRQGDLLIVNGTLTWKMAPAVKMLWEQMAEPKWVIAMGSCAISGGPFSESYSVVPGVNRIIPVDVYVPGCPPRPESLYHSFMMLREKIMHDSIVR
jgi:NADH-quinone oxidoreductase subunit B